AGLTVDHRVHPAELRHRIQQLAANLLGYQGPRVGDVVGVAAGVDLAFAGPVEVDAVDAVGDHRRVAGDRLEGDHVTDLELFGRGRLDHDQRARRIVRLHRAGEHRVRL